MTEKTTYLMVATWKDVPGSQNALQGPALNDPTSHSQDVLRVLRVHSLISITTQCLFLWNLETDLGCECNRVHVTLSYFLQVKCVCGGAQHTSCMPEVHKTISNVGWSLYVPCLKRTCFCLLVYMPGSQAWDHLGFSYCQLHFLQRSPGLTDVRCDTWLLMGSGIQTQICMWLLPGIQRMSHFPSPGRLVFNSPLSLARLNKK